MRPSKIEYYMRIATIVLERGTCIRRNYGAVIVKNDQIVSTGYTGAPRGETNCCDIHTCKRNEVGAKPGERYELCVSVHAESNAIIAAGRERCIGSTLYLVGKDMVSGNLICAKPCLLCSRMIINAGIAVVYTFEWENKILKIMEE